MDNGRILLVAMCAGLLQACSGGDQAPATKPAPEPESAAPAAAAPEVAAPESDAAAARVFIVSPANGATVTSPVTVVFGIEGFSLAPAGTYEAATGHHHLLVDTSLPPMGQPIPADDNNIHFGKAQTETILELSPGDHTLQLLLGDGNHIPHGTAVVSEPVEITVIEE